MTTTSQHLSQETLDLLQLAALDAGAAEAARQHLGACAACAARWSALCADAKHFEQFVFPRSLPRVEARAQERSPRWRLPMRFALPSLATFGLAGAAIAVFLQSPGEQPPKDPAPAYVGLKGATPGLTVFAQRAGGGDAFRLTPQSVLRPGDRLRFVVRPEPFRYVMVASLDGAGAFSVYAPTTPATSLPAPSDGDLVAALPGSIELDGTLGREVLAAFFSNQPLAVDEVERAVRADPGAPRVDGATVLALEFTKASP